MADNDLCYMSATEALSLFKRRWLSPVELMQAVIERAEAVNGKVNSLTETFYDQALEQAKAAETKYRKRDKVGALEGLPLAVKEEAHIKGLTATSGCVALKDVVAEDTSYIVERSFDAGAIMHVRTTTPEFSCAGVTHTKLWGVTGNPWNLAFTPGGSSGGTGATLAAGMTTLGTGSDIGGSIRIPASASGVVGFKPPYGRNPQGHIFNLDFYCHEGPMARTVADCALLQNAMSGPHPRDIASIKPKLNLPTKYKPVKGMKIAWSMDLGFFEVDKQVQKNTRDALKKLEDAGAIVEEVDIGWTPSVFTAAMNYLGHLFGNSIAPIMRRHRHEMTNYARWFADFGVTTTGADFVESLDIAGEMYDTFGPMMQNYEAFICPTLAVPSVAADLDSTTDKVQINGKEVEPMLGWAMTPPFNILSRCPVLAVPSGRARNNVPTGIQIVGRTYDDRSVFRVGHALEAADSWYKDADNRPKL
jgi:amidase